MSKTKLKILWIGPVLSEEAVSSNRAVSPAANQWQYSLVNAIQENGHSVYVLSHLPESAWPKGNLYPSSSRNLIANNLYGQTVGYVNLPFFRKANKFIAFKRVIDLLLYSGCKFDAVLTYNRVFDASFAAKYLRHRIGCPWISIVADDCEPGNASGYVFLSWHSYVNSEVNVPKLHLDGGVDLINCDPSKISFLNESRGKAFMYAGTLGRYGGVNLLLNAFRLLRRDDCELWICGKGDNSNLRDAVKIDPRIKYIGLLPRDELVERMNKADIFVNPRPSNIPGNERNFPSKLLEYLGYLKPIVSTMTPGVSPDYRDLLFVPRDESEKAFMFTMNHVLSLDSDLLTLNSARIKSFANQRTWTQAAERLMDWIASAII